MNDLHVKYRPEVFEEVIGQDHVVKSLMTLFEQNRVPHAFLFRIRVDQEKPHYLVFLLVNLNVGT